MNSWIIYFLGMAASALLIGVVMKSRWVVVDAEYLFCLAGGLLLVAGGAWYAGKVKEKSNEFGRFKRY